MSADTPATPRRRPLPRLTPLALVALLLALLPTVVEAGVFDAEWRWAPLYGADVRSLAFDPAEPRRVLAGTSAGQVYRSDDAGDSWRPAGGAAPFAGSVVGTLHFDANRPGRVWAGLWGLGGGGGLAYSDDLGTKWRRVAGGLGDEQVYAVVTVPGSPGRLYAGTRSGVYTSPDDGGSWRHLTSANPEIVTVYSLLVAPEDPRTIVAGTWRRAYRSTDGGESWQPAFEGMYYDTHLFSLHPVPSEPEQVWTSTCGWVYRSDDLGASWRRFEEGFDHRRAVSFQVLPNGRLLTGTVEGIHVSLDGGEHWHRRTDPGVVAQALAHHPANPDLVLAGTEGGGVWRSDDGGMSFHPTSRGMTNLRVPALLPRGDELLIAVRDAGHASGLYRLDGAGFAHEAEVPAVLALADAGGRAYAASERGLFERGGGGWRPIPELQGQRILELDGDGEQLLVRTGERVWERNGHGFRPLEEPPPAAPPTPPSERTLDTGDPRYATIAFDRRGARLLDRRSGRWLRLLVPVPDPALADAAVHGGHLYLATNGYGLIFSPLPP